MAFHRHMNKTLTWLVAGHDLTVGNLDQKPNTPSQFSPGR